jgi:hypothetical protein
MGSSRVSYGVVTSRHKRIFPNILPLYQKRLRFLPYASSSPPRPLGREFLKEHSNIQQDCPSRNALEPFGAQCCLVTINFWPCAYFLYFTSISLCFMSSALRFISSFTITCDLITPILNALGIRWCYLLILVINSFDALIRVSFPSSIWERDRIWFILQWSR